MILTNTKESDMKLFPAFYGSIANECPRCGHLIVVDVVDKDRYCPKCGWREALPDSRPFTVEEQREAVRRDPELMEEGKKFYHKMKLRTMCERCGAPFEFTSNRRYCWDCRRSVESEKHRTWVKKKRQAGETP